MIAKPSLRLAHLKVLAAVGLCAAILAPARARADGLVPTFTPHFLNGVTAGTVVAVADVNGDGALDIIAGNNDVPNAVYLNDGHGNFDSGTPFGAQNPVVSMAVGDLNGDGAVDIVQVGHVWDGQQGLIYLNDGHGRLSPMPFGGAYDSWSVALADLNGDGFLDIIQGNNQQYWDGSNWVWVKSKIFLNDGHGGFGQGVDFGGYAIGPTLAVDDLNGDGANDIVMGIEGGPGLVCMNDGAGNFRVCTSFGNAGDYTVGVMVADVNGDGVLDIILEIGNGGQSRVYLNDGTGHFAQGRPFGNSNPSFYPDLAVGDLNGDGAPDIVQGGFLYLNQGDGQFGPAVAFGQMPDATMSVALADLNGDGALDIVQGDRKSVV
jgi:hypothetical protein